MKNFARILGFGSEKSEQKIVPAEAAVETSLIEDVLTDASGEIIYLPVNEIAPNPFQPRKTFNDESLEELASSIRQYGVIQPLLVRRTAEGFFELVAGERRLRASRLAGLEEVPVISKELADKEMAELAMIENLQREDLHFLEEAEGFQQLIASFGFTQEELARRVGKNQSTIANKMRLLKLDPDIRGQLVQQSLTERHARALLKMEKLDQQQEVLAVIREKGLNVRETEQLIDDLIIYKESDTPKPLKSKPNVIKIIKDVRIFINTINKVVGDMKKAGLKIAVEQQQDDEYVTIQLRIPKRR